MGHASRLFESRLRDHARSLVTEPTVIFTISTYVVLEGGESDAGLLGHHIVALAELTKVHLLLRFHTEELPVIVLRLIVGVDGISLWAAPVVALLG